MRRTVVTLVAAAVMVAGCSDGGGAGVGRGSGTTIAPASTAPPSTAATTTTTLPPPPTWKPCGVLECATLAVPLDYANPNGRQISLALNRKRAAGPARRIGSLLVNPGGPGASGVDALPEILARVSKKVAAQFDVVGFDPRGTGQSSPVRCLPKAELAAYFALDPTPDTPAEKAELVQAVQRFAAGCQKLSGDLLGHVGTDDAARDMDRIRAALDDDQLTFLGFSYGTALGAAYARLFPNRVRAFVLDGALDPSLDSLTLNRAQGEGFDRAFDAFLADCRSQSGGCGWKPGGGATKPAFIALAKRLDARPFTSGGRLVGESELVLGVAAFLYSKQAWPALARGLAEVEAGQGTIVLLGFDSLVGRKPDGSYSNDQEANAAINCLDRGSPPEVLVYEQAAAAAAVTAPAFGPAIAWAGLLCGNWPVPATGRAEPVSAPGTPPILVVGTTNDPATPFQWAEALASQLPQGRLLRHEGDGHTAYGENPCTTRIADAYLLTLSLPAGQLKC